ncbi:biopolymer transporter ExbD [Pseudogulbenkiania sp. MAI-1]|uniref:biopolymer transporter ExbD n=1 Tax=Pseudogulbenkiania sp. MAI-1 TaxID=990370 RepID=UPI0004BC61EF|nr:biopolymer transporter ExbD [Pseudogulbenkiania sp. MAI-1]
MLSFWSDAVTRYAAMLNRRPRRQMNQMNVVPYIDVMLVLLVIFMVTTPLFTPGVIDVPSVSRAAALDVQPLEVIVEAGNAIQLKADGKETRLGSKEELVKHLRALNATERPVAISADQNLKYSEVVAIADDLHKAGIKRVALTVKQGK